MKTFRSIAAVFVFAAIFAISASAQVPVAPQTVGAARIVVIDTGAFAGDEKGANGITKYINAMTALNGEFKTVQTDLDGTANKLQTLQKEIQTLQEQAATGKVPVDPKAAQGKVDAFQVLQTEYKRKQEDAKARYERRQGEVMGPVMQDIFKALQDFTKQKGYGMILDGAKLDAQQLVLGFDEAKVDVTKEFITFYNGRGTTASTSVPK